MSPIQYLEEEVIISLLKNKDQRAFNYLYDNYSGALYGLAMRIVKNQKYSEEVIQDAFVKIWNNSESYNSDKGKLYTWIINIVRNTAIDYMRSKGVQNELKNQSLPNYVDIDNKEKHNFTILSLDDSDHIGIKNVLNNLKPEWKCIIELAYYEGYTQLEIAKELNIPLGTVKTRMRNALIELKTVLKDYK